MKKNITLLPIFIVLMLTFISCLDNTYDPDDREYQDYLRKQEIIKEQQYAQYKIDSVLIEEYLAENDSGAIFHEDYGIFYNVIDTGRVYRPRENSMVTVKYKGMLLDGTVFEQTQENSSNEFYFSSLIYGWQIGLSLIGSKGKIILYLPSIFGYAEKASENIPANSVLIFEIELQSFYDI